MIKSIEQDPAIKKQDNRLRYLLWSVPVLFIIWLAYDIGIIQAVVCIICWALIWIVCSSIRKHAVANSIEPITQSQHDTDAIEAFYIIFTNMLSDSELYDLLWLANAITLPISYDNERYYYDGVRKELFHTSKVEGNPYLRYIDKFDKEYPIHIGADIAVRLELINDESSEIVEIPRLNVCDKVGIQLEFLSHLPGTYWHNELIAAVEQQQDDHKFVLDTVLIENDNTAPMMHYWDDFKLKVTFTYINNFIKAIGLEWKILD